MKRVAILLSLALAVPASAQQQASDHPMLDGCRLQRNALANQGGELYAEAVSLRAKIAKLEAELAKMKASKP